MAQRYPLLSAMWKYLPINHTWPEQWVFHTAETPVFSVPLQLQNCPLALAWVGPVLTLLSLPLVVPEISHTRLGLRKPAFCLCHLPSQRDKLTQYYVKTCDSKTQKHELSLLYDKQRPGSSRHNRLGSTMPENNATRSPPQCVNHCLCWVLHWSTCCQWNSLPWQSFGSIVLLQMVIISSDLVRKWNAFSPLSWLFRQNINEIWKEFIHASGQLAPSSCSKTAPSRIHLPPSRHYKHWQNQDPSN